MGYVMLPALIPEIPRIYDIYFSAFAHEQIASIILSVLFPQGVTSPEFRAAHTENTKKWWEGNTTQYTYKCLDTVTGDIVGMLLLDLFVKERNEEERKNHGIPWLEGEQRERAEKILNPLWDAREELWGGRPYIYVHVIAVDPKFQGRKAAATLIQWGAEMGDKTGLPIYFESSPTTAKLYEKFGFQRIKKQIIHKKELMGTEEDIVVPLMVRMPAAAGGQTFDEWREKDYPAWES